MKVAYPQRQRQLQRLVRQLDVLDETRIDWSLLDMALTHPTASAERNYDRLEFVGDSVVRMVVAELLWHDYPESSVGEYTAIRSVLVSDRELAKLGAFYALDQFLLIGPSALHDKTGESTRLAEAFEALLAALYLSTHSLDLIRPWLRPHLQKLATDLRQDPTYQNYKAALQEWTQAHYKCLPLYHTQEASAPIQPEQRFTANVWLHERHLGTGAGSSIKAAEQAAAKVALQTLQQES
jgi:ribonuclease III